MTFVHIGQNAIIRLAIFPRFLSIFQSATRSIKTIQQAIFVLENNPEIGRPVEELLPGYRELVIGFGQSAYVALYQYDGEQVIILAIRHGREAGY